MGLKRKRVDSIIEMNKKKAEEEMKDQRIQDLELALADEAISKLELQARVQDLELAFADQLLVGGDL